MNRPFLQSSSPCWGRLERKGLLAAPLEDWDGAAAELGRKA